MSCKNTFKPLWWYVPLLAIISTSLGKALTWQDGATFVVGASSGYLWKFHCPDSPAVFSALVTFTWFPTLLILTKKDTESRKHVETLRQQQASSHEIYKAARTITHKEMPELLKKTAFYSCGFACLSLFKN